MPRYWLEATLVMLAGIAFVALSVYGVITGEIYFLERGLKLFKAFSLKSDPVLYWFLEGFYLVSGIATFISGWIKYRDERDHRS